MEDRLGKYHREVFVVDNWDICMAVIISDFVVKSGQLFRSRRISTVPLGIQEKMHVAVCVM
jgi:hypothetical protein